MPKKLRDYLKSVSFRKLAINIVVSLALFAIFVAVVSKNPVKPAATGLVFAVIYAVFLPVFNFVLSETRFIGGISSSEEVTPILSNITLDLMIKMYLPIAICNEKGGLVWCNKTLSERIDHKFDVYGKNIKELCGVDINEIMASQSEEGVSVTAFERFYSVKGYRLQSRKKPYFVLIFNDKSELNAAKTRLESEELTIAYIMVDNFDELWQYTGDKARSAITDIEIILKECAESVGGILKEYERERYILLFRAGHLYKFTESKFDILDKIREVRVGESNLPVTVSIGISKVGGTLADKERSAAAALDMALQRGGDQVVLKTETGMDFYGGKTKTVQKRTKVRARVVANELVAQMSKSSNVLIMTHRNPDFDAIGSCLGVARLAMFCGVKVNIVTDFKDGNFIICNERIKDIPEYAGGDIFVNSVDAQDLLGAETLLVITDVNTSAQFECPEFAEIVKNVAYIDHHRKTAEFENRPVISYIEPSASSACELVSEILEQALPTKMLAKEECDIMYAGILLDTKQFTRNAGVRTFGSVLYLRSEGAVPADAQTLFKTDLSDLVSEAKFEAGAVIYRGIMAISYNDDESNTANDRIAAAKSADKLLTVNNVLASFALCRIGDTIHISARSSGTINVQLILEKLEGGGHFDSAAAQLPQSNMATALKMLKKAIDEYLDQN